MGATSLAWGPGGELVLGRSVCRRPCGIPRHQEVWIWRAGSVRRGRRLDRRPDGQAPIAAGIAPDGRALWWADPEGSGSIAADGLTLYANRTPLAKTLAYPDYVVRCGRHLALAAGTDRYATHGKRILFDGRNVSRDRSRSWVSPSCSANGKTLVAAAGRNWEESRLGSGERRSIWQLLPTRKRLTRSPPGWTDEAPHLLPDGSIFFVRTSQSSRRLHGEWFTTTRGVLELLQNGRLRHLAQVDMTAGDLGGAFVNYYGHYQWSRLLAVSP